MTSSCEKVSPAKINLYLEIKGRRVDGYHDIESLMTFCHYGDILKVERAQSFNLSIQGMRSMDQKHSQSMDRGAIQRLAMFSTHRTH